MRNLYRNGLIFFIAFGGVYLASKNFHLNKNRNTNQYDQPDQAVLFEQMRTADPKLGIIPSHRLQKAHEYASSLFVSNKRTISQAHWLERGPYDVGGRTRAIMFDPNDPYKKKVLAGGVSGGLWVNQDITREGSVWNSIGDFLPSLAVTTIAYNPLNTFEFYFGTGEGWNNADAVKGNGIYKSTDGGATWSVLASTGPGKGFDYVQKIVVTNTGAILAAVKSTGSGGIYRSNDGGNSWQVIIRGEGADLEKAGSKLYASTGIFSDGQLWVSEDDGVNWEEITPPFPNGQRMEIGVSENFENVVYVVASTSSGPVWIARSEDGGTHWQNLNVPIYLNPSDCKLSSDNEDFTRGQSWYDLILSVNPENPMVVFVGGIDFYRSFNGGESWEIVSHWTGNCEIYVHADQHGFVFRPGYSNQAILSNDGGIYFSSDVLIEKTQGGILFEKRNRNYNVTQFYSCAMVNLNGSNNFLAGAQDNGTLQFNGIENLETIEVTGGDGGFCFIDQINSDLQISSHTFNSYAVTRTSWKNYDEIVFIGDQDHGLFINPADYNSNTKTLLAAGDKGRILRYANLNSSTKPTEEDLEVQIGGRQITAIAFSPFDDDVAFVGTISGHVYKLSNINSASITSTFIGSTQMVGYANNIAIGSSENELLIVVSNYGVESLWYTANGGSIWQPKEGNLPDMPIRWALFNPANYREVLLATELGVWSTADLSDTEPTWTPTNSDLANVRCDMLKYRPADGMVVVATHGRGLFTTDILVNTEKADFKVNSFVAYEGVSIGFENLSTNASSYLWDFGDGQTSNDVNPSHIFKDFGKYEVKLSLDGGVSFGAKKTVSVLPYLSADYSLSDGGDFESNADHFASVAVRKSGFERGVSNITGKDKTHSGSNAWVLAKNKFKYDPYTIAYLYTPAFDFTASGDYVVSFYTKYVVEDEWDGFIFESSIDSGNTWNKIGDFIGSDWYNQVTVDQAVAFPPSKPFFSGNTSGQYVLKKMSLKELSNNAFVCFRFSFRSDPASEEAGVAIDDFGIIAPSFTETNLSFESSEQGTCPGEILTFTNNTTGLVDEFVWDFGAGASPASAIGFGPHEVRYSTTGLKSIKMTASTSIGELSLEDSVNIIEKPIVHSYAFLADTLCAGEKMLVQIDSSILGVTYELFDHNTFRSFGEPVIGSGNQIILETGKLTSGNYEWSIRAAVDGGCMVETPIKNALVRNIPLISIVALGSQLSCNIRGANYYQWYFNGEAIEGANSVSYLALEIGEYYVEIGILQCEIVSDPYYLAVLESIKNTQEVKIYPNPTSNYFNIEFDILTAAAEISIYDFAGREIKRAFVSQRKNQVHVSDLQAGTYVINIKIGDQSVTRKILIK